MEPLTAWLASAIRPETRRTVAQLPTILETETAKVSRKGRMAPLKIAATAAKDLEGVGKYNIKFQMRIDWEYKMYY